jgi:hypothetical protein
VAHTKEQAKVYYEANKEAESAKNKDYYQANKESVSARRKANYQARKQDYEDLQISFYKECEEYNNETP